MSDKYAAFLEKVSRADYELPSDVHVQAATPEGHAQTLEMLLGAAESVEDQEMIRRLAGRPTLGQSTSKGKSPMWKVRAEAELDSEVRAQAEREGRNLSDIIRDGVRLYLNAHPAA